MKYKEFVALVDQMMQLQTTYFRFRDSKILEECKRKEREVRKAITAYNSNQKEF